MIAVQQKASALKFASNELRNGKDFIRNIDLFIMPYIGDVLKNDGNFVLICF